MIDSDTEALLTTARKHLCQFAVLKYQQMDGLNTVLPFGVRKIDALRTLTTCLLYTSTGGEAAEQIVRMSLEGFEVAAKITGDVYKRQAHPGSAFLSRHLLCPPSLKPSH